MVPASRAKPHDCDVAGRDGGVNGLASVCTGTASDGPRGDEQPANAAADSPAR
jgi:hypothetical protein